MRLFGLAGWKRSGKTELMTRLLPALAARGLRVSAIKEARHDFDIDQPGKDSFLHRVAGASEVILASSHRWALMHERRGSNDDTGLAEILEHMTPVDLVLVEGFRHESHRKLEVFRAHNGKTLLAPGDPTIVGIASDVALEGIEIPVFGVDDTAGIAELVIAQSGLTDLATPPALSRRIQGGAGQS